MNLKNIIAVSGQSGLMELVTTKTNGLILMDPTTKKTKFYSVRLHQFTPLETVGIYTSDDTIDLKVVFQKIRESKIEMPSIKSSNQDLLAYMGTILPDFDRDKVYPGDVKKVIKWYTFCNDKGYLDLPEDVAQEEVIAEELVPVAPVAEPKKAAKKPKAEVVEEPIEKKKVTRKPKAVKE